MIGTRRTARRRRSQGGPKSLEKSHDSSFPAAGRRAVAVSDVSPRWRTGRTEAYNPHAIAEAATRRSAPASEWPALLLAPRVRCRGSSDSGVVTTDTRRLSRGRLARTDILLHSSLRPSSNSRRRASCAPQHRSRLPLNPMESGRRAVAFVGHSGNSPVSNTN